MPTQYRSNDRIELPASTGAASLAQSISEAFKALAAVANDPKASGAMRIRARAQLKRHFRQLHRLCSDPRLAASFLDDIEEFLAKRSRGGGPSI